MAQSTHPAQTQQTIRQRARSQAREMSAHRREERAREEKRLSEHAERVLAALWERDAVITATESRAGAALLKMTRDEGLSLRDALQWCGNQLGIREATRLRRLATDGVGQAEPAEGECDGARSGD